MWQPSPLGNLVLQVFSQRPVAKFHDSTAVYMTVSFLQCFSFLRFQETCFFRLHRRKKTCLLPRITNNMIISIVLIYKYYCGMPFYENKYNNLMFLIELLKLCFSYYEQFQIFGLCQFILFKLLWDILYLVAVGLWKRKQGKHAIFQYPFICFKTLFSLY